MKNGKVVAVKKLTLHQSMKVDQEFESEVKFLSNIHHRNLIRLLGCCAEGKERILIYEYMKNSSLDKFLFGMLLSTNKTYLFNFLIFKYAIEFLYIFMTCGAIFNK